MDLNKLAQALIPDENVKPLDYYEQAYPERDLPQGAHVTRLAPSPTGFMHLGNLYVALANERIAHQSGGVFYLRIEDTDEKRKVDGAVEVIHKSLKYFGVNFDEGADLCGEYGPYYQRQRAEIYHAYAKELIRQGLAYPCFCTEEDLEKTREYQTENKLLPGYYGEFAKCRNLTEEEIYENLKAGKPYVIRLKSQGDVEQKHTFHDQVKGDITVTENNQDVVILKSDGIPTYHFAHAIDDHFMRTTLVIRGEEWLSSLPIHIELFKVLGFKLPKYGHNCSIQKIDGETRRKLSKRKDPEASLTFYREQGYHPTAVRTYMMTLLNSNFEEWLLKFPDKPLDEFKYSIGKMGKSGALFDILKLNDISKTYMSTLSAEEMFDFLADWTNEFGTDAQKAYFADKDYLCKVLTLCMGIGGKKRRKDFVCAKQAVEMIEYFFDNTFAPTYEYRFDNATVKKILCGFKATYDVADDMPTWFEKVKAIATENGFATDMKAYKADPTAYPGNVSDVAEMLRIATTGLSNTPDLWTIMQILGEGRTLARIEKAIASLSFREAENMKAYLQEFFREFSYAAGDAQILTDAYDIIAANSQANALFTSAIDAYEKDICIDYATEIFGKAKQVANTANLHPYTVTLLAFICLTKRLKAVYLERGLDMQIYKDSVLDLRWKLDECKAVRGICGTFLESWFPGFFKLERFALGRLQFELIPAWFDYDKNGVKIVKDESKLVNVHIPRTGTPLDKESCDKAYQAAREFFRAENGETYPFVCWSWLLFPDNKQLFSEKSNTYRFLSEYDIIDVDYDNGENLWRLFDTEERNPDRLPTDTRVRRNYVAYLKSGKRVGWGLGIKL